MSEVWVVVLSLVLPVGLPLYAAAQGWQFSAGPRLTSTYHAPYSADKTFDSGRVSIPICLSLAYGVRSMLTISYTISQKSRRSRNG